MRILAFADLHSDRRSMEKLIDKSKSADVVICAGDLTDFESGLKDVLSKLDSMKKPVLIIPGNHEIEHILEDEIKKYKYLVDLHKKYVIIGNHFFFGFGSGGFARREPELQKIAKDALKNKGKDHKFIFITHGPPYKTELDELYGDFVGNADYTDLIKKEKPDLVVCGHIHENFEKTDMIGNSLIINPGPDGKIIEV